jgi:hypothetical protein
MVVNSFWYHPYLILGSYTGRYYLPMILSAHGYLVHVSKADAGAGRGGSILSSLNR